MARLFRIECTNAIYHLRARGNGRQKNFRFEDADRRMVDALENWRPEQ